MTPERSSVFTPDVPDPRTEAILGRREGARARKILAVSSGGGHWAELVRLAPALAGHHATWVTTAEGYRDTAPAGDFRVVRDASRWDKAGLLVAFTQLTRIVAEVRPDVVVTTGAAPGYLALRLGNIVGATTIWLDSIANAEELSLSGKRARGQADLHLTQWAHLVRPGGPQFHGSVL